jgi:hypothetical protein
MTTTRSESSTDCGPVTIQDLPNADDLTLDFYDSGQWAHPEFLCVPVLALSWLGFGYWFARRRISGGDSEISGRIVAQGKTTPNYSLNTHAPD